MHQLATPADAEKLFCNGRSQVVPIISASEVDHSRIEIKPGGFDLAFIGAKNVVKEIGLLDLKRSGEAGCSSKNLRMIPGEDDAADPAKGRAQDSGVRRFRKSAEVGIDFGLQFLEQESGVLIEFGFGVGL